MSGRYFKIFVYAKNRFICFQPPPSVDLEILFGNMVEVVELSQRLLGCLEANVVNKHFNEHIVGQSLLSTGVPLKKKFLTMDSFLE